MEKKYIAPEIKTVMFESEDITQDSSVGPRAMKTLEGVAGTDYVQFEDQTIDAFK